MIKEGSKLPNVTFKTRVRVDKNLENPFEWKDMTTSDYFKDKKCILFALPGAFTPTCSSQHLPGYKKMYQKFIDLGIDEVYCLSVNDAFVMRRWGIDQGLEEDKTPGSLGFKTIKLISDGTAEFTQKMGMSCFWSSERGFGERSWRYSAYIDNCIIKKLFVEQPFIQNSEPDPFEVSDAETMMNYLKNNVFNDK
jgi:peroxiredoxin